jgi:hypothetical protein
LFSAAWDLGFVVAMVDGWKEIPLRSGVPSALLLLAAEIVLLHLPKFLLMRYPMVWSGEKTDQSVFVLLLFKSDMNEGET